MALTLEVAYANAAALAHDAVSQLAQGGLHVPVDASALPPLAELTLRLVLEDATFTATARLTVATAEAACVEIDPDGREALLTAVALHLGATTARPGKRTVRIYGADAQLSGDAHGANAQLSTPPTLERRISVMSVSEKMQLALHGNREARALLLRERAGVVQSSLARNPTITLDEVQALARSPHLSPEAAETLSQHPSWGASAGVVLALVRNPRTPLPTATSLVARLVPSDLRVVAKGLGVRPQVAAAARKRMVDPER
jgi:hypothetical protein